VIITLLLCLLALLFASLIRLFGAVDDARTVVSAARDSLQLMHDRRLTDRDKERALRRASGQLFGQFLQITLKSVGALAIPTLVLVGLVRARLIDASAVKAAATDWRLILAASVVALAALLYRRSPRS